MMSNLSLRDLFTIVFSTAFSVWGPAVVASTRPEPPRQSVSLDGQWQVAEGSLDRMPSQFDRTVPVPGLIDMARPALDEVGRKSSRRDAFWYRRTFTINCPVPANAILKLHKVRYGAKVFLNGQPIAEHMPCFTPAYIDVRPHLKGDGQQNELVVRVGAHREILPADVPTGWDFEKYLFIPGIYDSVELILTGAPMIRNVQIVPEIESLTARLVVEVVGGAEKSRFRLVAEVAESRNGKKSGAARSQVVELAAGGETVVDFGVPIADCRLWSPEDPFLYQLRLRVLPLIDNAGADATGLIPAAAGPGDTVASDAIWLRFGMRSFRFDRQSKRAMLNGKPYMMRGTNVCIYRFFEDADRGDRPWRAEWVRRLHEQFKTMHWNSIRYCIGFPPEFWYDVADEVGFLIQDEFPIWLLSKAPENPTAEKIISQYRDWMRERWNHPCVVIWDAQNESFTDETGKAIQAVRDLDLSRRPWENGWSEPQSPDDCVEVHPYLFIRGWQGKSFFRLSEMPNVSGKPSLHKRQQAIEVPIIINEYAWLWLDRQGNPTCLTDKIYENLLGPNSTVEQRRELFARYLAAKTEFWRCHREVAGVLHFCGLGYSRPGDKPRPEGGATSDHFVDIEKLTYEPMFAEFVRESFNPLGLMLDFWVEEIPAQSKQAVRVFVINDRGDEFAGEVRLFCAKQGGEPIAIAAKPVRVAGLGRKILHFEFKAPELPGKYRVWAEVTDPTTGRVRSLRDVNVVAESRSTGELSQ